ncbi:amidohydrolase family protein [Pseudomaricurvus alkylphenolicus]|jgi:imidazolonepropionase-like amidohydrolase|uniref:amidohydrolase family protein n=1 Tax=Pseudomaricurvus alkylphenolicus TaxID=1306991 RepID=UPI0014230858|nr:amidohydrolase family protein [Pseudomaricurvus alkylphenolicus]NIB42709.1 amidohydrolase family protein [Pseudomaricurvus alkylphenolicus]
MSATSKLRRWFGALVAASGLSVTASLAADAVLISNADVYTPHGIKASTDVLIRDGVIRAIGPELWAPDNARRIDATGMSLTPGFFNGDTHLGVEEISAIESTVDTSSGDPRVTAAMKVADGFNPDSILIPHNRMQGLTHALVTPESNAGLFAGQAALITLNSHGQQILNDSVAVVLSLGESGQHLAGGSRAVAMALVREALDDAKDYAANKAAVRRGERRDYALSLQDLNALGPVVSGRKPLIVHVERADDILRALKLGKDYGLKLILAGVSEGWRVADEIAAGAKAVIFDPIHNLPDAYESLGARLDNARIMQQAGVKLIFTGMGWQNTHNAFLVRQSAGNAVANGLDKLAAINAMTLNPAEVFGLKGGKLAVGSPATLVLWSGDPLEMLSEPEMVLIEGREMSLVSRATRLRDRYFRRLQAHSR